MEGASNGELCFINDVEKLEAELYGSQTSVVPLEVRPSNARFQDLLTAQLRASQTALGASHEQVLQLIKKHLERSQQAEAEVVELRVENEMLRHQCGHGKESLPKQFETERPQGPLPGSRKDRGMRLLSGAPRPTDLSGVEPGAFDAVPDKKACNSSVAFDLPSSHTDTTETLADSQPPAVLPRTSEPPGDVAPLLVAAEAEQDGGAAAEDAKRNTLSTSANRTTACSTCTEVASGRPTEQQLQNNSCGDTRRTMSQRSHRFELLSCWGQTAGSSSRINVRYGRVRHSEPNVDEGEDEEAKHRAEEQTRTWIVFHPYSMGRTAWDLGSIVAVMYDMVTIPLQMFEPEETWVSVVGAWMTRVFWTSDIYMSFVTGFLTQAGHLVMTMRTIARRYLTTWFIVDALIVGVDWLELLYSGSGAHGYVRLGKASRTFRIIRMVRLLRLIRMREIFDLAVERLRSERLIIVANICKLMTLLLGFSHLIACFWYGLGVRSGVGITWTDENSFAELELGYRYSTSLHWALSQLTGGMDEVRPCNTLERVYSCVVFVFGFIAATVFLSSLTSSMTQLHLLSSRKSKQLSILRRYLFGNRVPSKLAMRIQRNATHALAEQERHIPDSNIELLGLVSEPLRIDLHFAMYAPHFMGHVFFEPYVAECPQVMRKVCHSAMTVSMVSTGDVLFHAGEISTEPKMYIVTSGALQYIAADGQETDVTDGTSVSEAALWVHWMHRGMLRATSKCWISTLDSLQFQGVVLQFDHQELSPKTYASQFVADLNELEDPTDLPVRSKGRKTSAHRNHIIAKTLFPIKKQATLFMGDGVKKAKRHMTVRSMVEKLEDRDSVKTTAVTPVPDQ